MSRTSSLGRRLQTSSLQVISVNEDTALRRLQTRFPGHDKSVDVMDFLYVCGSPVDALMYLRLFWPSFIEIDGMVIWSDANSMQGFDLPTTVRRAYDRWSRDKQQTEKACNLVEVPQLFLDERAELDDDELCEYLIASMCETWSARLRELFPGRVFSFERWPTDDKTGEEAGFRFWEERS